MKAKFFVIDFINYVFLIAISIFIFFYFMQGNRLMDASKFFSEMSKFSFFAILFLLFFKKNAKNALGLRETEKKTDYFQIIKYLSRQDEIKDWIYLVSLPTIIMLLAYFFDKINKIDIVQAVIIFYLMVVLHKLFFKKKNIENRNFLTMSDKMVDEVAIYSLPMFVYGIAIIFKETNTIDFVQSIVVLSMSLIWHYFYFKPKL